MPVGTERTVLFRGTGTEGRRLPRGVRTFCPGLLPGGAHASLDFRVDSYDRLRPAEKALGTQVLFVAVIVVLKHQVEKRRFIPVAVLLRAQHDLVPYRFDGHLAA